MRFVCSAFHRAAIIYFSRFDASQFCDVMFFFYLHFWLFLVCYLLFIIRVGAHDCLLRLFFECVSPGVLRTRFICLYICPGVVGVRTPKCLIQIHLVWRRRACAFSAFSSPVYINNSRNDFRLSPLFRLEFGGRVSTVEL